MNQLILEAPADSGATRVRLTDPRGEVHDWLATPFDTTFRLPEAPSGSYHAVFEPLGQPPVSYAFQVTGQDTGQDTHVQAPRLSELRSSGSRPEEIKDSNRVTLKLADAARLAEFAAVSEKSAGFLASAATPEEVRRSLSGAGEARPFVLGLSQNALYQRGRWRPYAGPCATVEPTSSGVDILIADPPTVDDPLRLRLSMSLGHAAVERFLIPRYRGGVRLSFRASSLTTADVVVKALPEDPQRRALVQALEAASTADAAAVATGFANSPLAAELAGAAVPDDPWTAVVIALLGERFEAFRLATPPLWTTLTGPLGWMADTHVLAARDLLRSADATAAAREAAADQALDALARARRTGAPYYVQSSNLMGEMLSALEANAPTKAQRQRAAQELKRWRKALALRGNIGAAFSWMVASRRDDVDDPDKTRRKVERLYVDRARGLQPRFSMILFQGEVGLAQIRPCDPAKLPRARAEKRTAGMSGAPKPSAAPAPAFDRKVRRRNDPNWHRFGGQSQRHGFRLGVRFGQTRGRWVEFTLTLDAPAGAVTPHQDYVEFYLHDSFEPDHYRVTFRGDRASLACTSWGGFTVGAWLPKQGIELELDLAKVDGAPGRIQRY